MTRSVTTWARLCGVAAALYAMGTASIGGQNAPTNASPKAPPPPIHRRADGMPDLEGIYQHGAGGTNFGLERHATTPMIPAAPGVIVDPSDGKLPMLPWAAAELAIRSRPDHAYDDPSAHCFPGGVPRAFYIPQQFQIVQPPGYVLFLFERMSWRIVPLDGRRHLPETTRLWQGDSLGHWDGDTLVIDTANFNGKTWLSQNGEIVSYAERVIERLTPVDGDTIRYEATITDPVVYTRPWTMAFPFRREPDTELLEAACHEDDQDLPHLKELRYPSGAMPKE